ncbi:hypothetical protein PG993_004476 [Apiospora rasikravindrae]|uniref:Uncharacterized protein n=1 Tax=Apiospora rasikravindrae TaxID=990691 RepID=A0ABR1TDF5_9PEZI
MHPSRNTTTQGAPHAHFPASAIPLHPIPFSALITDDLGTVADAPDAVEIAQSIATLPQVLPGSIRKAAPKETKDRLFNAAFQELKVLRPGNMNRTKTSMDSSSTSAHRIQQALPVCPQPVTRPCKVMFVESAGLDRMKRNVASWPYQGRA